MELRERLKKPNPFKGYVACLSVEMPITPHRSRFQNSRTSKRFGINIVGCGPLGGYSRLGLLTLGGIRRLYLRRHPICLWPRIVVRARLRFLSPPGSVAFNFPCTILPSLHEVSIAACQIMSNIWSEDLSLVENPLNSSLAGTQAQSGISNPSKLRKSGSTKDLKKDAKKWAWDIWAKNPEGYDQVAYIQQMRSKVLISQQSKVPLMRRQIDEYWKVCLTQISSVKTLSKGKGVTGTFSEAVREQFFKALGLLWIQELRIHFLNIKQNIDKYATNQLASPPPKYNIVLTVATLPMSRTPFSMPPEPVAGTLTSREILVKNGIFPASFSP